MQGEQGDRSDESILSMPFRNVLEAVDALPIGEQEELLDVVRQRVVERRRKALSKEVAEAEAEYIADGCEERSATELMEEILS